MTMKMLLNGLNTSLSSHAIPSTIWRWNDFVELLLRCSQLHVKNVQRQKKKKYSVDHTKQNS